MTDKLILRCPTCNKPVRWSDASPYRPFCSKRCQQVDLGAWAGEDHRIAGDAISPDAGAIWGRELDED